MMKQEYKYGMTTKETAEEYKYASFAMETASEYKYQIAMETVKWNTSKQFIAKETALQNVYKYSSIFFFFFKQSECRETESRKWKEVFQGRNSPGLEGYLR